MTRVGQNRIYTPYMTVYLVVSLPKYRICTVVKWFWPTLLMTAPNCNGHFIPAADSEIVRNSNLSQALTLHSNKPARPHF